MARRGCIDAVTGDKLDVPPLPLMASVVSPNGVAVGSTIEGDLWIFDPDTLEKLDELPGLHGYAELLTLNADGTTLAAENESDGIRIYDVPTRTQLGENIPDVDGALGTSRCALMARSSPSRTAASAWCCGTSIRSTGWTRRAHSRVGTCPRTSGTSISVHSASTTRVATATAPIRSGGFDRWVPTRKFSLRFGAALVWTRR